MEDSFTKKELELAKSVDLYKIPDLIFVADTLYDQGAKIDNIINSWKK